MPLFRLVKTYKSSQDEGSLLCSRFGKRLFVLRTNRVNILLQYSVTSRSMSGQRATDWQPCHLRNEVDLCRISLRVSNGKRCYRGDKACWRRVRSADRLPVIVDSSRNQQNFSDGHPASLRHRLSRFRSDRKPSSRRDRRQASLALRGMKPRNCGLPIRAKTRAGVPRGLICPGRHIGRPRCQAFPDRRRK